MRTSIQLVTLIAALALSVGSAGNNRQSTQDAPPAYGGGNAGAAQSQPMAESKAHGLWKSSFGAVKMESDPDKPGSVRGIWLYERNGEEVVGYFAGALSGTNFSFSWEEPTSTGQPLIGGGYLVFDPSGRSFRGKWWTTNRDRGGDWTGWRAESAPAEPGPAEQAPPPDPAGEPSFDTDEAPDAAEPSPGDDDVI